MFDIGFWELVLIFVVALVVVGPERLPGLVRTAGLWVGKARRIVSEVRAEIEQELQIEELRRSVRQQETVDELKRLAGRVNAINAELNQAVESGQAADTATPSGPAGSSATPPGKPPSTSTPAE